MQNNQAELEEDQDIHIELCHVLLSFLSPTFCLFVSLLPPHLSDG